MYQPDSGKPKNFRDYTITSVKRFHEAMPNLPEKVTVLLDKMTAEIPNIFGDDLVGIYLYGSLTQKRLQPKT